MKEQLEQIARVRHELDTLEDMIQRGRPPKDEPEAVARGGGDGRKDPPEDPGQP